MDSNAPPEHLNFSVRTNVLPGGFEPPITVPKTVVISVSPRERVYIMQ